MSGQRHLPGLLLLAALSLVPAASAQRWLGGEALETARRHLMARDYRAAVVELERLLAEHPEDSAVRYALVRAAIEGGDLPRAAEHARAGIESSPADGLAWAAMGDVELVLGDFEAARRSYYRGAQYKTPRARIGLGRILDSERERPLARIQFEKAFAEDPEDPATLFAMARQATDLGEALELVRAGLAGDFTVEPDDRAALEGHAESRERLEGGGSCEPVGEPRAGEIKLRLIRRTAGEQDQLGMKIALNGSKPVISMIDTGASGILVTERVAAAAGVRRMSDVSVAGLGRDGPQSAYLGWVEHLTLGDREFEDCLVTVTGDSLRSLLGGHDSLMGLDQLYPDFEVTLDFRGAVMGLTPLPPVPRAENGLRDFYAWERDTAKISQGYMPIRIFGYDLLVPTLVNAEVRAYFLLDSGASTNFLSERLAARIRTLRPSGVGVRGLSGEIRDVRAVTNVQLSTGALRQQHDSVLALDLDGLAVSAGYGMDGILGYDLLRHAVVSIDARNALVRLVPARR